MILKEAQKQIEGGEPGGICLSSEIIIASLALFLFFKYHIEYILL